MASPPPTTATEVARPQPTTDEAEDATATRPSPAAISDERRASILVAYRSVGLGTFGAAARFAGMPLEKIALFLNSSRVAGKHQFAQAVELTFRGGPLAPYRVVGPASVAAWFLQYGVMGLAFQFFDRALSESWGVAPAAYGEELLRPPSNTEAAREGARAAYVGKTLLAPVLAGALESSIANRAEVQRYFGPTALASLERSLGWNPVARWLGPAFAANAARNVIMCHTSFVVTPITYQRYFPQDRKSPGSLFWYGMGVNVAGNAVAITQQALWGRALDHAAVDGGRTVRYRAVIASALKKEGIAAFFTAPKWCSRILMNAPVQGALPWFYNDVLPRGEGAALAAVSRVAPWTGPASAGYGTGEALS